MDDYIIDTVVGTTNGFRGGKRMLYEGGAYHFNSAIRLTLVTQWRHFYFRHQSTANSTVGWHHPSGYLLFVPFSPSSWSWHFLLIAPAGRTSDVFAASVDLFPTFLDAAKVNAPPHVLIDGMMMIVMMMMMMNRWWWWWYWCWLIARRWQRWWQCMIILYYWCDDHDENIVVSDHIN